LTRPPNPLARRLFLAVVVSSFVLFSPAARANAPWDAYRLFLRGLLKDHAGHPAEAVPFYQQALQKDPEAVFVQRSLAEAALGAGRLDVALAAAERVAERAPRDAAAHVLLGRARLAAGRGDEAQTAFDRALRLDPSNLEALRWSTGQLRLTNPAVARDALERFLDANSETPQAEAVREGLADILRRQGDAAGAEAGWKKILKTDPDNREARLGLAGLFDVRGDTVAALSAYDSYLALFPEDADVLARVGQLEYIRGNHSRAEEAFARAAPEKSADPIFNFWRALAAQDDGRWEDAALYMSRTAASNPQAGVLLRLASYHQRLNRPRDTVHTLRRLQRAHPENADFLFYLAQAYEDGGWRRAAIRWYARAVKKDPRRADAEFHLGLNWDQLGRFARAVPHLRRAIDLDPHHHIALNYLGYLWADRNENLAEALELIQRAVALDPDNPAYRDSLGWALFRLGRWPEAETALAASVHPADDPLVWAHYGDVLNVRGKADEASRAWQEGVLLDPGNKELLDRLGVKGAITHVAPRTAARTLLKRVEGQFRQIQGVAAFVDVEGRWAGRAVAGRGVWHYRSPDRFRLEILGPFFAPEALMIHTASGTRWFPPESASPEAEAAFVFLGAVLSGEHFRRFDVPEVNLRFDGARLVYEAPFGRLAIEGREKTLVEAAVPARDGSEVRLRLGGYIEQDGLRVPTVIQVDTEAGRVALSLSRVKANPPDDASLFQAPPTAP